MISDIWKIQASSVGFAAQTFASLKCSGLEIEKASQVRDEAKFRHNVPFDSPYLWPYKTICTILKNNRPWFSGRRINPAPDGTGQEEFIEYLLAGPWWDLEQICYMQMSNYFNGNTGAPAPGQYLTPVILLGYELIDGLAVRLTTGQQIANILAYAITAGANLQVGTMDEGFIFPISEEKGKTCAALIQQVMRSTPDAVLQFDYSTSPPTAHLVRRTNGKVVTMGCIGSPSDAVKLTPRYDLLVACVALYYLATNQIDKDSWITQTADIYPPESSPAQIGALVASLQLAGERVNNQLAPVVVESIPIPSSAGGTAAANDVIGWFQRHCAALQGITIANLSIANWGGSSSWEMDIDPDQFDLNGNVINFPNEATTDATGDGADGGELETPTQLPNALMHGNLPPWRVAPAKSNPSDAFPNGQTTPGDGFLHAAMCTVKVRLTYNFAATGISDAELARAVNAFGGQALESASASVWFLARVKATDAATQVYEKPIDVTYAETPPTGLAEFLYSSLSLLHFEGDYPRKQQECDGAIQISNQLNLTGGRAEWATMLAQVQKITEKIDTGETISSVGPPKHLSPSEILDLLRSWRTVNTTQRTEERQTGKSNSTTGTNDGVGVTSQLDTAPASTPKDIHPFASQDNGDGTITLPKQSYLIDTDEVTSITISNLTDPITATAGQKVWLQIPITSDQDVDPTGTVSIQHGASWPSGYPISLDTSDPAFVFQNWLYVKILEFVTPSSTGNALQMVINGSSIVKVVPHTKTNLLLKNALVNGQSIWGLIALPTTITPAI